MKINYIFGIIYLVLFLINVFTSKYSVIFYTQALLTGYCLSSFFQETNTVFPLWVSVTLNAISIVYDRTLVVNTVMLCVEWVHFTIIMTVFLARSKENILSEEDVVIFNEKLFLLILFIFDIIVPTQHLGILIWILLEFQNPIYILNEAILVISLIHIVVNWDYYNLIVILIISFYSEYGRRYRVQRVTE